MNDRQTELKEHSAHIFEMGCMEQCVYLKNDADAVIEAKDAEIAKMNARIDELEANVDLWKKENRKLKRALYKACANWAGSERYTEATWHDDEHRELLWASVQAKCLSKTEEYK